jgi:hypothetical protein
MSDSKVDESMIRADRLSKVIALFVALGVFLVAFQLTDDGLFNMIVAAIAGIGTRIYIPYHASVTVSDPDPKPIQDYEGTGNYHQGAVGAAAVLAAVAALATMAVLLDSTLAFGAGVGTGVVLFLLFRGVLPT